MGFLGGVGGHVYWVNVMPTILFERLYMVAVLHRLVIIILRLDEGDPLVHIFWISGADGGRRPSEVHT